MKENEKFIEIIQEHPEYYKLFPQEAGESKFYLSFLNFFKSQAKSKEQIHAKFPGISESDLRVILDYLIKINLLQKIFAGTKTYFFATDTARSLLEEYEKTKHGFDF